MRAMAPANFSHLLFSTASCFSPLGREAIELRLAVVLRQSIFRPDPSAPDQAVQRGVQRPLLDLQDVVGVSLDGMGDGMPMRRPEEQGPQDQHVQRALQGIRRAPFHHH